MKRVAVALLLAIVTGCGTPHIVASDGMPVGYVPIDRGEYEWRCISADGVIVGLRTFAREPAGSLDFWASVIQKELEGTKGYVFESAEPFANAGGVAGRAIRFGTPRSESTLYYLVLFVTDARIVVLEAGGPRAPLEKDLPTIKSFATALKLS